MLPFQALVEPAPQRCRKLHTKCTRQVLPTEDFPPTDHLPRFWPYSRRSELGSRNEDVTSSGGNRNFLATDCGVRKLLGSSGAWVDVFPPSLSAGLMRREVDDIPLHNLGKEITGLSAATSHRQRAPKGTRHGEQH